MGRIKRTKAGAKGVAERLEQGMGFLGETPQTLFPKLGYKTPATIYAALAGRCFLDITKLALLAHVEGPNERFLNLHWLITGDGVAFTHRDQQPTDEQMKQLLNALPRHKRHALAVVLG